MKKIKRRDFIEQSVLLGGSAIFGNQISKIDNLLAAERRFQLNVGYLPISDHLILPVSHALDNKKFKHVQVKPRLCRSWEEIQGKLDMGILHGALLLAPLAMYNFLQNSSMRCILLGHRNGSVITTNLPIADYRSLLGKTIGIPHPKSTHTLLLYKYLLDNGVKELNSVKLITIPPSQMVRSMKLGIISGYTVSEPWGIRGINQQVASILAFSHQIIPNHVCCILVVNKYVLKRRKSAIMEWVNSLQKAGEFIHKDPEQAGCLQQPYMNHQPIEIAQVVNNGTIAYNNLSPDKKSLTVIQNLAFKYNILPEKVDLDRFIDRAYIG